MCNLCANITPWIGITSTPVIDPTRQLIYVEARTKEIAADGAHYEEHLYAINIQTGAISNEVLIADSIGDTYVSGPTVKDSSGGLVQFDAMRELNRPGLTLSNGIVYIGFGSDADEPPFYGWILGYDASNLALKAVFNAAPNPVTDPSNVQNAASIWQGGAEIATDASGNLYVMTGNGNFDNADAVVAAGSDGQNVTAPNFTLQLDSTAGFVTTGGTFFVITSNGTATVTYTGLLGNSLINCNVVSGSGLIAAGKGVWQDALMAAPSGLSHDPGLMVPISGDYGDSFLKLTPDADTSQQADNPNGYGLHVSDYFTPHNQEDLDAGDIDLGSGGPMLLPDFPGTPHPQMLVGAGKEGIIYLIDRNNMGGFDPTMDHVIQEVGTDAAPAIGGDHMFGTAAYFNGVTYWAGTADVARAFAITTSSTSDMLTATSVGSDTFNGAAQSPSISANGTTNGLLWVAAGLTNKLYAYNPSNLNPTVLSVTLPASVGFITKFGVPMIANGHVYLGTDNSGGGGANNFVVAYGLTPPAAVPVLRTTAASGQITLNWVAPAGPAPSGYDINRSTDGINFSPLATGVTATSYVDATAATGVTYYYQVTAVNSSGTESLPITCNIVLNVGVTSVSITLPPNSRDAVLQGATAGNSEMVFVDNSAWDQVFQDPTGSMTINASGGSSFVQFLTMDSQFMPTNLILTGAATDTFINNTHFGESDVFRSSLTLTGATFDLSGTTVTFDGINGTGTFTNNGPDPGVFTPPASTLIVQGGSTPSDFSGSIQGGSGSGIFLDVTSGTLILSGANACLATTVAGGTLQVDGSLSCTDTGPGTTFAVDSGGTLQGTGTITGPGGTVTVNSGGILAPGDGSPGTLHTGAVNLNGGSEFMDMVNGVIPGTGYGQLISSGAVSIYVNIIVPNPVILDVYTNYTPASGDSLTIISGTSVSGTFGSSAVVTPFNVVYLPAGTPTSVVLQDNTALTTMFNPPSSFFKGSGAGLGGAINNAAIGGVITSSERDYVSVGSINDAANDGGTDFGVTLYNTTGGVAASTTTSFNSGTHENSYATAVAIYAQQIFVTGTVIDSNGDADFAVASYSYNGTPTLQLNWSKVTSFGIGLSAFANNLAILPALAGPGTIAAVGSVSGPSSSTEFAIQELDTNGNPIFGSNGLVMTPFSPLGASFVGQADSAQAAAFDANGKLLVAGYAYNVAFNPDNSFTGNQDFALARYDANGTLDQTFGTIVNTTPTGLVATDFGGGGANAQSIAVQSDGKIVVAGYTVNAGTNPNGYSSFALARYTTAGAIDTTFDATGKQITSFGTGTTASVQSLLINSSGTIDAAGYFLNQSSSTVTYQIAVAQYVAAGTLDPTFNASSLTKGQIVTAYLSGTTALQGWGQAIAAINSNNFVVAGGASDNGGNFYLAVANYDPPVPDSNVSLLSKGKSAVGVIPPSTMVTSASANALQGTQVSVLTNLDGVPGTGTRQVSLANPGATDGTGLAVYALPYPVNQSANALSQASGDGMDSGTDSQNADGPPDILASPNPAVGLALDSILNQSEGHGDLRQTASGDAVRKMTGERDVTAAANDMSIVAEDEISSAVYRYAARQNWDDWAARDGYFLLGGSEFQR